MGLGQSIEPVIEEIDEGAEDLRSAPGVRLEEVTEGEFREADGGEEVLGLAVEAEDPNGVGVVVGVVEVLQRREPDLVIGAITKKHKEEEEVARVRVRVRRIRVFSGRVLVVPERVDAGEEVEEDGEEEVGGGRGEIVGFEGRRDDAL